MKRTMALAALLAVLTVGLMPFAQGQGTLVPQTGWTLHFVDSEETVGEDGAATNAFDGDTGTFWHSEWQAAQPPNPHEIQIDLGATHNLTGFSYLPRQSGSVNGTIAEFEFYVSTDGTNWGTAVATGTWPNSIAEKVETFAAKSGRYIRLVSVSEVNGNEWASVVELNVYETAGGGGGGSSATFGQCEGPNFQVVIEAEDFDARAVGSAGAAAGKEWQIVTDIAGFSGTGYIQSLPNDNNPSINVGNVPADIFQGPHVEYNVNFSQTGAHYVHVRHQDLGGEDDSLHMSIDDADPEVIRMNLNVGDGGTWEWQNIVEGDTRAIITVPSAGDHVIKVWMREDGTMLDKIVLTPVEAFADPESATACAPSGGGGGGEPVEQGNEIWSNVYPPYIDLGTTVILTAPPGSGWQWSKDGSPISGATDRELIFNPVNAGDAGVYTVSYTDESSAAQTTPAFNLTISAEGTVPVAGGLGLAALMGVFGLTGAGIFRKRK